MLSTIFYVILFFEATYLINEYNGMDVHKKFTL